MKQKYLRNHQIMVFENIEVVILQIPKKDYAITDNHQLLFIVKKISYKKRHRIQIKFGIFNRLYPTSELIWYFW